MADPYFDQYAETYDEDLRKALSVSGEGKEYFAEGRMEWLARWLAGLGQRADTVLDFGCGTGTAIPFALDSLKARKIVGEDVSEESLAIARQMHSGEPRASFRSPDGGVGASFDLAFCNGVFHHIDPERRGECLTHVLDSLRPGGIFALFENNPWNPATRYVMSRCAFDADAITLSPIETRSIMRRAGFRILTTRFLFVFPAFLNCLRFLESPLSPLPLGTQYVVIGMKPTQP